MPKGVYKKTREHIAKVVGNLIPGYGKGMKFPERSNKNNPMWKGDKVGYQGIHTWLRINFRKTSKCEQCGDIKQTEWALLKGKQYERKRENFIALCHKCHANYDRYYLKALKIVFKLNKGNTYRRIDLIGQRFGKLVVVSLAGKNKWGNLKFFCKCDCGGQKIIPSANLRNGRTKSCGCIAMNRMVGNKINQGRIPWNKKVR